MPSSGLKVASHHRHTATAAHCTLKTSKTLTPGGQGVTWSPSDKNSFIYTNYDSNNVTQLYQWNVQKGTNRCLTCTQMAGGPLPTVNKGWPAYGPKGSFLVLQATMPQYQHMRDANPGSGFYQNLWAWNQQSGQWFNLTNYPITGTHGVLLPRISHNGKMIAWAEVYHSAPLRVSLPYATGQTLAGPVFGFWRIDIADLISDTTSIRLANIRSYQPGNADFYETQDWSPDDKSLLFASDIGTSSAFNLNVWKMDVASGQATALTHLTDGWAEHATYSSNGKYILYMSSACCHVDFTNLHTFLSTFETELYIARADGSGAIQLTHSNGHNGNGMRYAPLKLYRRPSAPNTYILEQQYWTGTQRSFKLLLLNLTGQCGSS